MGDLTKNLSRSEFACKCGTGCGQDTVDFELVNVIQTACEYFEASVTITSGNRCPYYNDFIGGHPKSFHMYSKAADLVFKNVEPRLVAAYFRRTYPTKYGIGEYDTFTHLDVQSKCKRW